MSTDRDNDLQREIQTHLELEATERESDGMSKEDARYAALRAFGNVTRAREDARAVWTWSWLDQLSQDVRYGVRSLRRTPGFALAAVAILALGISAATAMFSVINAVVFARLPFDQPDRLVRVWQANPGRNIAQFSVSLPLYRDWRDRGHSWRSLAALKNGGVDLIAGGTPQRVPAQFQTWNAFATLGVHMTLGRSFLAAEDQPNRAGVAILSDALWRRTFGADPGVLGRTITVDGRPCSVVGVAPADFLLADGAEIFLPLAPFEDDRRGMSDLDVYGRLKDGVTLAGATAEMSALSDRIAREFPDDHAGWSARVVPLSDVLVGGSMRRVLFYLLLAVGVFLLIACANLSGLLLVRASTRTREIAIRAALGGGRGRIVRQLVTESLLLAGLGGAAGVALAYWSVGPLQALASDNLPRADRIAVDPMVLMFACAVTIVAGVLAGVVPAAQASRLDVHRGVKEHAHSLIGGRRAPRNALIIGQLALSIVLIAAAGLMLRTLDRLNRIDLGFAPTQVLTLRVAPRANGEAFVATLLERVARLPGVTAVGATSGAPMTSGNTSLNLFPVGAAAIPESKSVQADWRIVSEDYFRAMGIALVKGRVFTPQDNENAPKRIIVNRTLARLLWGNVDPVGRQVNPGGGTSFSTVIGVVDDVRSHNPGVAAAPTYYMSAYRGIYGPMTLVVRSTTQAEQLVPSIRTEVQALDATLPIFQIRAMEDLIRSRLAPQRLTAGVLATFAGLALLLAVAGVYGVVAYATAQRTREVGIRLALGARRTDVLRPLMRDGATLILGGIAVGIVLALPAMRLMRGFLTDVSPGDPLTFAGTTVLLAAASLVACYVPARRALKVDPIITLRAE